MNTAVNNIIFQNRVQRKRKYKLKSLTKQRKLRENSWAYFNFGQTEPSYLDYLFKNYPQGRKDCLQL